MEGAFFTEGDDSLLFLLHFIAQVFHSRDNQISVLGIILVDVKFALEEAYCRVNCAEGDEKQHHLRQGALLEHVGKVHSLPFLTCEEEHYEDNDKEDYYKIKDGFDGADKVFHGVILKNSANLCNFALETIKRFYDMIEDFDEEMIQFEKDHPARTNNNSRRSLYDDDRDDRGRDYGRRNSSGNGGGSKTVMIVLAVVAALLLGVLLYVWISKNALVKELNVEKENLTEELVELQHDYDNLSTENADLNDSLVVEKEKVGQLIERLQKTEATNRAKIRQYEKELGTLRSIMKSYIKQIDSLNTLNTELRADAAQARREAQESKMQYDNLRTTTDELSKRASAGAVVKGRGVVLSAINSQNKPTDRSSRVKKLKTCLSLIENTIAEKGYRTVYIRVKGPDGVLLATDSQNKFTCSGEQMIFSASREVDYQGDEVEICIYFENPQGFVKGVYTVDVYTDETKIGSADLLLK